MEDAAEIKCDTIEGVIEKLDMMKDKEMNLKVCINEIICMTNLLTNLCSNGKLLNTVDVFEQTIERLTRTALYPSHLNLKVKSDQVLDKTSSTLMIESAKTK